MKLGSIAKTDFDSWTAAAIVFSSALLLFCINLDRPPHPDELHHVLAAQQLLETGRPLIGEGEYWRGIHHTWLVAVSYEIFGEGLASSRIPAALLVALVASILFIWVRREAGSSAAWFTAVLFVLSPFTVEIAQFSRFYALQMFSFVLGSMCIFYSLVATTSLLRRMALGLMAIGLLGLAISAQVTSFVGLVGIAVWSVGLVMQRVFFNPATKQTSKWALASTVVLAGTLVVAAATQTDAFEWAWETYRETPLFNADQQNEFWFYHVRFLIFYPTLWPLVGVLAVFAIVRSSRLGWLAVSIFSISFLLMSFAGSKATRYLSFAPPFLAIIWGIGLAHVWPFLARNSVATRTWLTRTLAFSVRLNAIAANMIIVVAVALVIVMNPFWLRTATLIGNVALPYETPATDWRIAREALAPWVSGADILITTEELGALYFLGRSDVRYSPSKLEELAPDQRKEFGIDFRTGRPIISKPESLEQLIDCFPRGIVTGPAEHWGNPILISEAVQGVLRARATRIDLPEESNLYAWGWAHERNEKEPSFCSDLHRFSEQKM